MKVQELFESEEHLSDEAKKECATFLKNTLAALKKAGVKGIKKTEKFENSRYSPWTVTFTGSNLLKCIIGCEVQDIVQDKDTLVPKLQGKIVVDIKSGDDSEVGKKVLAELKAMLASKYDTRSNRIFDNPWYGKGEARFTTGADGFTIKYLTPKSRDGSAKSSSGEKYDPKQAHQDRKTPAAKSREARIAGSQFADSHGGDSSNYR
jgi:hypothetical protein